MFKFDLFNDNNQDERKEIINYLNNYQRNNFKLILLTDIEAKFNKKNIKYLKRRKIVKIINKKYIYYNDYNFQKYLFLIKLLYIFLLLLTIIITVTTILFFKKII